MVEELPDRGEEVEQTPRTRFESADDDLAVSLSALSRLSAARLSLEDLLTEVARLSLEDLLTEVATFAVQAIPGADGAGLTLLEADRADTIVKSAPFVREVDDIQYRLGEGPCISAAALGRPMRSGSLGGDHRWPRFGPRVGRLGVHSVLSLPLISADQVPQNVKFTAAKQQPALDSWRRRSRRGIDHRAHRPAPPTPQPGHDRAGYPGSFRDQGHSVRSDAPYRGILRVLVKQPAMGSVSPLPGRGTARKFFLPPSRFPSGP